MKADKQKLIRKCNTMARIGPYIISSLLLFSAQAASATGEDRFRIIAALMKERFITFDQTLFIRKVTEGGVALRIAQKQHPEKYDRYVFTLDDSGTCSLNRTDSTDEYCEVGQTFIKIHKLENNRYIDLLFKMTSNDEVGLEFHSLFTTNYRFNRESIANDGKLESEYLQRGHEDERSADEDLNLRLRKEQQSEGSRSQTGSSSGAGSSARSGRYAYCISSGNGPEDKSYFSAVFPLPSDWGLGGAAQVVAFRAYTKSHFASHNVSVSCMFESSRPAAISKRDSYMAEARSNHDVFLTDWKYGEGD